MTKMRTAKARCSDMAYQDDERPSGPTGAAALKRDLERARAAKPAPQPEKLTKDTLRIICTKCPAVVKVHHLNDIGSGDSEVWVECHDTHLLGWLPKRGPYDGHKDYVLSDIRAMGAEHVYQIYQTCERESQEKAERAQLLKRYLDVAGFSPTR